MYFSLPAQYYTIGNATWNVNGNWSTDGGITDCSCNPAGQSGITVNISHDVNVFAVGDIGVNNTINLAAVNSRLNLHVLPTNTIAELNGVSGSNLVMLVNGLPNVTTNNFITTPNTTVQFVSPTAGAVPDNFSGQNYQNLIFMNGAKIMNLTTNRSVLGFIDIYDNLTISSGATTTLTATGDITLHNAANLTISSPAKLLVQRNMHTTPAYTGSISSTAASLEFDNLATAKYIHNHNGGSVPSATWQPLSECRIIGVTNTMPTGWAGQNFGNLTWDCTGQTAYLAFNDNFNIQETFRVENARDGATPLGLAVSNNGNYAVTTKNFIMDNLNPNSAAFYPYGGSNASDVGTLRVEGNLTILNQTTGVLSGIGKSRILLTGSSNSTFHYDGAFSFYGTAVWEVEVAKNPGFSVTFTSPINYVGFSPASGTPTSILNITSGEAVIPSGVSLDFGVIQGSLGGKLTMQSNASLYLRGVDVSFNNTFAGILDAHPSSTVFYDSDISQNIFAPSSGSYGNITLMNAGIKNLPNDISLTGNWTNSSTSTFNFNAGISTVTFNGTALQTIGGTTTTEFYGLNVNNDVSLVVNTRLKGTLNIANNKYLTLNSSDFITLNGSNISVGLGAYIVTNNTGSFVYRNDSGVTQSGNIFAPLGRVSPNQYAAIDLPIDNLGAGQEIKIRALTQGVAPAPAITFANRVEYVWEVVLPAGVSVNTSNQGTFSYTGSVIGTLVSNGRAYYHNGTNWVAETTSTSDNNSTTFTPSAFSGVGTRYYGVFAEFTDFYTLGDNAIWNVNSNLWSNDGSTPCNCSPNGVANANVRIRHNATIPVGSSVGTGAIINIENPVTLVADLLFTANTLSGVAGARLAMSLNGLPTFTTNNFITTPGTIVEFTGGAGTIPDGFNSNPYQNLYISGTGTKNLTNTTIVSGNLQVNSGTLETGNFNLSVSGTTTILAGATFSDATSGGINRFTGSVINNGNFTAAGGGANTSIFQFFNDITNNGTFNLDCNCSFAFNKTGTPLLITPTAAMTFGSAGGGSGTFSSNTTIANGQLVTFNVTNAANLLIANDILVLNNNTVGVQINGNGTLQGQNANSTWRQGLGAVLAYASDQVPMSMGILDANTNDNIVNYNRTGNQALKATTYRTLQLTNASIKEVPAGGSLTVTNPFTIPAGVTFIIRDGNFTADNIMTVNGTWQDTQGGGTNTFNNVLNIGSTGVLEVVGTNTSTYIFNGNITNQGIFNLQDSSQWRLNGNLTVQNQSANVMNFAQANSGTGQINGNVIIADFAGGGDVALYTNVGSPISGSGSLTNQLQAGRKLILEVCQVPFTNAAGAVVEYRGNADIPTKNCSAADNLFIYASGVPSISASTFHHLRFTNTSTNTLGGDIIVNGFLEIAPTATLNTGANNINIKGNWIGNGTFNGGTGSVVFDGTSSQTITTSANAPFNNIEINNVANVAISTAVRSASITLTAGRLQTGNFDLTLTANPATNQITQSFTNTSTSYIETNGTGSLVRENLLTGNLSVFPIGDATAIRHIAVTPNPGANVRASFDANLVVPPPGGSTSVAAGRWLVSGTSGVLNFYNTGATSSLAKVHRLNAGVWDDTGITTTGPGPTYTTNSINFSTGEIYTLFATAPVTIVVSPTNANLPNGQFGATYTLPFSATGGTAPYAFAVTAGSLPPGLTLNPTTGVLDGTLSLAGTYTFTITATDASSNTGSQSYTLTVIKASQSVIRASATVSSLGNNRYQISAVTTQGLPTQFFSTNTQVARIEGGNIVVILVGVGEANIMAYEPGDANIAPSDTVVVMRVDNFALITALSDDLNKAVNLYPNPTNNKLWIRAGVEVKAIEIYNALGQMQTASWQIKGEEIEIETIDWARGVYFLHIHTPFGELIKRVSKL
ncbi:MAG: hypothetical protein Fur0027_04780 [Raineya sp.]